MKKLILISFAIGMMGAAQAQETVKNYDTNEEMQAQMRLIANTLGLDATEIYQLGQIMAEKKEAKENTLAKIDALKKELESIEANSEKQIQGMLTEAQWEKYQAEIKEKVQAVSEEHMKTIDK